MSKEQEQALRDFYFSFAEMIAMYENCEKLCPTDNLLEMCETLAGIMAEQNAIIEAIQSTTLENDWKIIRDKFRRPLVGERFYSLHLDALCDMMRLAKHMKDVSESKDRLLKSIKRLERFNVLPPIDIKLLRSIIDAIPIVKALKSDE